MNVTICTFILCIPVLILVLSLFHDIFDKTYFAAGAPKSAKFRGGCRGPSKIRQRGGCTPIKKFFSQNQGGLTRVQPPPIQNSGGLRPPNPPPCLAPLFCGVPFNNWYHMIIHILVVRLTY